jgi:hypothetical protein
MCRHWHGLVRMKLTQNPDGLPQALRDAVDLINGLARNIGQGNHLTIRSAFICYDPAGQYNAMMAVDTNYTAEWNALAGALSISCDYYDFVVAIHDPPAPQ